MPSQTLPAVSQSSFESASEGDDPPYVPVLGLDRDATIQHANEAVRRTLEYPPDAALEPCFFSHVHGRNLRQVMRDLAHMVSHRKQRTRWLLRLRTGNGRWRWYRATAQNQLDHSDALVRVRLRPL
jgi:PAS domain-containing protein